MGEVRRAVAPGGDVVAIKALKASLASNPEIRRRFTREARAAAALDHPNIVRLLDFGSEASGYYLVMELVDGRSMARWRGAPPNASALVAAFTQILGALSYAHARGVIHRDLKPENVLVGSDADDVVAKVMDFGVVHFRDEADGAERASHALLGTPAYMAPEQGLGLADASPATDLYAVGVMLFELLTGARPHGGDSAAATLVAHHRDPIPAAILRPGYAAAGDLAAFFARALAKDPTDRFMFASDMLGALCALELTGRPAAPTDTGPQRALDSQTDTAVVTEPTRHAAGSEGPGDASQSPTLSLRGENMALRTFPLREPPFTGEEANTLLTELNTAIARSIEEGRPGALFVTGATGSGKTRLLRRLQESLEERGAAQVWFGLHDGRPDGPEVGIRQAMRRGLGVATLGPAELRGRVGDLLDRQGVDDPWEIHATAELLLPDEGGSDRLLTSVAARAALVRRTLERAARRRPVVLILDDVHLGSGDSLRTLASMLRAPGAGAGWCAVVSAQAAPPAAGPGYLEALEALLSLGAPQVQRLEIPRTSDATLRAMVSAHLPPAAYLAPAIARRAEGSPLVAVELLRHLVDSGRLEDGATAPTEHELLSGVPASLGALVARRLQEAATSDLADAHTLDLWERLAFLGLRFPTALAIEASRRAAVGPYPPSEDSIERAIDVGMLTGILAAEDNRVLRFESALVRDALVSRAFDQGHGPALHAAAGDAKSSYYSTSSGERAIEIAEHYTAAGAFTNAVEHWRRGAHFALDRRRNEAALEAFAAMGKLAAGLADRDAIRLEAAIGMAEAQLRRSRFGDAREHALAARAFAASRQIDEPPVIGRILADVAVKTGALREATRLYDGLLEREMMSAKDRAELNLGRGMLAMREGQLSAAEKHLMAARRDFLEAGDALRAAESLRELAQTAARAGLHAEASELAQSAFTEFAAAEDRHGGALCELTLADTARALGDLDAAEQHDRAARALLVSLGDWHAATLAVLGTGRTAAMRDARDEARRAFEEAQQAFAALGDRHMEAIATLRIAHLDAGDGLWHRARPRIEAALDRDRTERIDDDEFTRQLVEIARQALLGGHTDLARSLLEVAAFKLDRTAEHSPLYDDVDEVQYLLSELEGDGPLDEPGGVVDLFADESDG
jgi:serine/threonine protein kinase